jgi:hypothetical protein
MGKPIEKFEEEAEAKPADEDAYSDVQQCAYS